MNSIISYRPLLAKRTLLSSPARFFHLTSKSYQLQQVQQEQPPIVEVLLKRNTVKPEGSRKTFLIDFYKHLFTNNEIVLLVHRNNLVKADNDRYRQEIQNCGGEFNVIKNNLLKVYLKYATHKDPASKSAWRYFTKNRDKVSRNPLIPLLNGPTGVISIKECDPKIVAKILKFLKSTNEKLFLIGGKIDSKIYNISEIDSFKDLKSKDELNLELLGILTMLSGAGLVRTLETTTQSLYLTMKSHENELTPKDEEEN